MFLLLLFFWLFYFLITYGVCKKRKYCNRMSEKKKNSLLLTNVHVLYVLEDKTSKKNSRLSIRPSVRLSGCLAVRTWTFHVDTITFEGVSGSKQNLVGVFRIWNIGLVLKSKVLNIMILILILIVNRILIFTKTLRSDAKFGGYL